ncbi:MULTISPECIES: YbfB/YjiJ family MFS transporter [Achromobacter]|uniref:YbfB/YjiJ family MFS transporter n=1 Tax=Achromobacter spanius TaxID=217203 RepID=A0ABY8GPZ2_9BURK|nr:MULTISPECIES: YbfB/YjiJ family MFS transporter [Achromobacter]WAI83999.1 YbfB/YjiJ family MFS transporter [Achromobacter spanius]WEX94081.1 YbfB/YjiJ family MFS transporter [Achromobacter sp. SS2-2022]WFP06757.1 YbfB/YjiJ family MFS transporter [Achromobacter spanius]
MSTPAYPSVSDSRSALSLAWPAALALASAMGIGRFAFTPVWPLMAQEGGLSLAQGSWIASANYAGYLLGALAAVAWPVRHARAQLAISLLAVALLTLAMPLTHDVAVWCALRLAAGYASASAFICVASSRAVPTGDPREAATAALTYAGVGAGIALTGLACLVLMAGQVGADGNWLMLGALTLALSAMAWPGLNRPAAAAAPAAQTAPSAAHAHAANAPNTASTPKPQTSTPPARLPSATPRLALHYGVFGVGYIIPATFLPAMAKQLIPNPAIFGWAWPLFGLAAAVSCLLVPRLARGRDEKRVWQAAQALMAAGMLTVALWHHIAAVIVAALLVGGTFMVITQAGMLTARRMAGAAAPRAAAIMTAAFAAGQILGPLLASWAGHWGAGLPQVLGGGAALLALSAWRLGKITTEGEGAGHNAIGPKGCIH